MPLAATLIPTVGGLIGGLFGSHNSTINGTTLAQTQGANILNNQAALQNQGAQAGLGLANTNAQTGAGMLANSNNDFANANNYLTQASSTLGGPASYYSNILSGNKVAMMGAMAPEISQINSAGNAARNQLSTMGPMGGGRASAMAQLPYQTAGQIGTMFQQARPAAAQGLLGVGNAQANLGGLQGSLANSQGSIGSGLSTNALSNLLSFGSGGTQTGSALANFGLGQSQLQNQAGQQFGGGISNILSGVPWGSIFGGSSSSSGSNNPNAQNWGY